jgi:hypothetical protein
MIKRCIIAAMAAALLAVQVPGGAWANERGKDHEQGDERDGQSRYELAPLNYLPLLLAASANERILRMCFLLQTVSYMVEMTTGVKATNQNRVNLGGLFGGLFADVYSSKHFLKSLEVGTVYNAGNGLLAVAMAGEEVLSDHRVIVFNGDYQYDPTSLPTLQQIAPAQLQKLQAYSLMSQLATYALGADVINMMASLGDVSAAQLNDMSSLTEAQRQTEIPALRQLIVGKVYRGPDNTLLVVIPPAIVLDR